MNVIINSTIDFNNKLLKSLCESDNEDEENQCLISGEPLEDTPIKLKCNHKFNYHAILNEVKMQKKYTSLETFRLKTYQIKCPYCRCIQNGVLPWKTGYPQLKGVNFPISKTYKAFCCCSILKSGKRKGLACGRKSIEKLCPRHINLKEKSSKTNTDTDTDTSTDTNTDTELNSMANFEGCQAVLKSGKRKGDKCKAKVKIYSTLSQQGFKIKIGYCKRHYKPDAPQNTTPLNEAINLLLPADHLFIPPTVLKML